MSLTINSVSSISSSQISNSNVATVKTDAATKILPNNIGSSQLTNPNVTLTPSPIIRVNQTPSNDGAVIESPYIKVTQQLADNNKLQLQDYSQANRVNNNSQEIKSLTEQEQYVQSRQQQLQEQETEINREISQLQQKELEINRKKFQLQQQTTGNLLNIEV